MESLLFNVRARDPLVIASVVALVGAVGVLASATATRQGCASIRPRRCETSSARAGHASA